MEPVGELSDDYFISVAYYEETIKGIMKEISGDTDEITVPKPKPKTNL